MIGLAIFILLFLLLGYYANFLFIVHGGLRNTVHPSVNETPFVSILVAARNEERTLGPCLQSLIVQDYPKNRYEIIVIDDHSTDGTGGEVRRFSGTGSPSVILITLKDDTAQAGKPAAITAGVENAKGEIIACTDADCLVPSSWLKSMAGCFEESVAFTAGPVLEDPGNTNLGKIQSIEFLGLITTAAGLIGSGKPIICNGANLAYRKSAFRTVGGYGSNSNACDDETLMQRMNARNTGRIVFNADPAAAIRTSTPATPAAFWRQRTRWAAKRGSYEDAKILRRLLLLYAFFAITLAAFFLSLIETALLLPFVLVVATKGIMEYVVLRNGARVFHESLSAPHFLIAELFQVPYIVLAAFAGQFGPIRWKERRLDQ